MFDQIYGWEYTLLKPSDFWKQVPDALKPIYHFFNSPISAGSVDSDSPLRFIKEMVREEDYLSFKLDIDTPEIEIPIVLNIAKDPELWNLIDEFFFEFHFRCEILMYCAWENKMPAVFQGLILDRPNAMHLFASLREKGIRAHFWP